MAEAGRDAAERERGPAPERPAARGRPVGDHAARRAELLEAATAVLIDHGYAGTSLRKVAQRAGCTTGTVTYYFANKTEMIVALTESRFDRYDALLSERPRGAGVRELLERWFGLTAAGGSYGRVMSQLVAYAPQEPAVAAVIRERYARFRDANAAVFAEGQRRGVVRDDVPADVLADQIAAMGDGVALLYPVEPERFTPARLAALVDAAVALVSPAPDDGVPAR